MVVKWSFSHFCSKSLLKFNAYIFTGLGNIEASLGGVTNPRRVMRWQLYTQSHKPWCSISEVGLSSCTILFTMGYIPMELHIVGYKVLT